MTETCENIITNDNAESMNYQDQTDSNDESEEMELKQFEMLEHLIRCF